MARDNTGSAPSWVTTFFDTATGWWPKPQPGVEDVARMRDLERMCGRGPHHILDLGAGGGTTAKVLADHGHTVTALELSPVRATAARELAAGSAQMTVIEGDFLAVELDGQFPVVTCWNGFGVGRDHDQRQLLKRVANSWLTPGGYMLLDVFNPWYWARIAGESERISTNLDGTARVPALLNSNDFDLVTSRFSDSWWLEGDERSQVTQSARCYTPADFCMLVSGTGLRVLRLELEGIELESNDSTLAGRLYNAWEWRALLTTA